MLRTGGRLSICLHRPTRTIKSEQAVYDFGLQGFWEEVAQSNGRTRRRDTYTVKLTKLLSRVPSVQHLPLPGVLPTPSYIQVGRRAAAKPGARAALPNACIRKQASAHSLGGIRVSKPSGLRVIQWPAFSAILQGQKLYKLTLCAADLRRGSFLRTWCCRVRIPWAQCRGRIGILGWFADAVLAS